MARLGDYVTIRTGKLDANAASKNGQYPFFTCAVEPLKIDHYAYDCECVLVAGNGDLNVKYYSGKFNAYQRTYIIESRNKKVLSVEYLYYFLDNYIETLREQAIGGVIKYIKLENLTEAPIPIPSIQAQAHAVQVLRKSESLIKDTGRQISLINELVKSQFIEMFGLPGTDSHSWGLTTLGACCELNPRKPKDIKNDTNYSFLAMPSVSEDGRIDASIEKPYLEVCKGFTYFAENDVLFAKITPCMENGKGGVAKGLKNGVGFGSTEFHVLRPIKGISNPYWLYIITMFPKFRSDAEKVMTGTGGQRRVPITYLNEYRISLPPIELQNQFAAFVRQSDKSKFTIRQSLEKLETLKKSLMQQYFS